MLVIGCGLGGPVLKEKSLMLLGANATEKKTATLVIHPETNKYKEQPIQEEVEISDEAWTQLNAIKNLFNELGVAVYNNEFGEPKAAGVYFSCYYHWKYGKQLSIKTVPLLELFNKTTGEQIVEETRTCMDYNPDHSSPVNFMIGWLHKTLFKNEEIVARERLKEYDTRYQEHGKLLSIKDGHLRYGFE